LIDIEEATRIASTLALLG